MKKKIQHYFFDPLAKSFLDNAAVCTGSKSVQERGDFFKLKMPLTSLYVINDPDILKHILIDQEPKYEKSKIYWRELRRVIGKAMGSIEGEEWTVLKQLQKAFFTRTQVQTYLQEVNVLSRDGIRNLNINQEINLLEALSIINFRIILKSIFGISTSKELVPKLVHMIEDGEAFINWRSKYPWRPYLSVFTTKWFQTQRALNFIGEWVDDILHNHSYEKNSLTEELVKNGYSNTHIRNEMIVHLGASTETVAVTESWTVYLLSRHPDIQERVQEEIQNNYHDGQINFENFPVLTACIKEAMRLYPPSHAIVRDCVSAEGDIIDGIKINQGDVMYISAYGIHRNPNYWENPDEFMPERFLDGVENTIHKYAFLPFAAGKHACIGKYLAIPMVVITLVHLLYHYKVTFEDNQEKIPISLSTLKAHNGFFVKLQPNFNK